MQIAELVSEQSYAVRARVGAVLVRDDNILAYGYNGTPTGLDNCCEDVTQSGELVTKAEVLHAESNVYSKVSRSTQSSEGSTLYVTLSPCLSCSKIISQSGTRRVVFRTKYRETSGIDLLEKMGIEVLHIQ